MTVNRIYRATMIRRQLNIFFPQSWSLTCGTLVYFAFQKAGLSNMRLSLAIISTLIFGSHVAAMPTLKRKPESGPDSGPEPQFQQPHLDPYGYDGDLGSFGMGTSGHTFMQDTPGAALSQPPRKRIRVGDASSGSQFSGHPQNPSNQYSSSSGGYFRSDGHPPPSLFGPPGRSHQTDGFGANPHEWTPWHDPGSLSHNSYSLQGHDVNFHNMAFDHPHVQDPQPYFGADHTLQDDSLHRMLNYPHSGQSSPDLFQFGANHALQNDPSHQMFSFHAPIPNHPALHDPHSFFPVDHPGQGQATTPELAHPRPAYGFKHSSNTFAWDEGQPGHAATPELHPPPQHNSDVDGGHRCSNCGHLCSNCNPTMPTESLAKPDSSGAGGGHIYNCNLPNCSYGTDIKRDYNRHLKKLKHTGVKPYKCTQPGCNSRFTRPDDRNKHVRKQHGVQP